MGDTFDIMVYTWSYPLMELLNCLTTKPVKVGNESPTKLISWRSRKITSVPWWLEGDFRNPQVLSHVVRIAPLAEIDLMWPRNKKNTHTHNGGGSWVVKCDGSRYFKVAQDVQPEFKCLWCMVRYRWCLRSLYININILIYKYDLYGHVMHTQILPCWKNSLFMSVALNRAVLLTSLVWSSA